MGQRPNSILIGSKNDGKIREITSIIKFPGIHLVTYEGLNQWPDIKEEGSTYRENALIKARILSSWSDFPTIADDSGLEVTVLDGAPGIQSARYAGADASDADRIAKLLHSLRDTPAERRTARFRCVAVYIEPEGAATIAEGTCEGSIALRAVGIAGFGYDPVFIPEGHSQTLAEFSSAAKNEISHRGRAFRKLKELLDEAWSTS